MYVRKVRRKCGVRGCRHTTSFAISLTSEVGRSVIICEDCLRKASAELGMVPAEPEAAAGAEEFICPHCGQVCKSEIGLQKHIAAKHKEQA